MIQRFRKLATVNMIQAPITCLTCRQHAGSVRGNCRTCYHRHAMGVRAGKTTWAKLEKRGLAAPARRRGEKWRQDFSRWMRPRKGKHCDG